MVHKKLRVIDQTQAATTYSQGQANFPMSLYARALKSIVQVPKVSTDAEIDAFQEIHIACGSHAEMVVSNAPAIPGDTPDCLGAPLQPSGRRVDSVAAAYTAHSGVGEMGFQPADPIWVRNSVIVCQGHDGTRGRGYSHVHRQALLARVDYLHYQGHCAALARQSLRRCQIVLAPNDDDLPGWGVLILQGPQASQQIVRTTVRWNDNADAHRRSLAQRTALPSLKCQPVPDGATPTSFAKDGATETVELSVVIPAHGRPQALRRCLAALAKQNHAGTFEVIVVDDGSDPPLTVPPEAPSRIRLVRRAVAAGPASARNVGASLARGDVLVFTDDDTIPSAGWLRAAYEYLSTHPDALGVEGPTRSPSYDRLTGHSVDSEQPGAYLTCNVAYRARAFLSLGGFCQAFPYPHCEDLDFGLRAARKGSVGFAQGMEVTHPPRRIGIKQEVCRARMLSSEVLLRARHPDLYPDYRWLPLRLRPVAGLIRVRARLLRDDCSTGRVSPRRVMRWGIVSGGQIVVSAFECIRVSHIGAR